MSATLPEALAGLSRTNMPPLTAARQRSWSPAIAPALFGVGLLAQLVALVVINRPLSEGSSYYVDVARNLATGRGLVIDAMWSYATPPLTLPRPAFELWQPVASFVAALPMALLGPTFAAAQLGFAVLGALLAPLAWLVARDATRRLGLPERRAAAVTIGAGVLSAISGPLLLAGAAPDSTLPFAVAGVSACLLMPRAIEGDRRALVALGVVLGLAYLTRMEAVWFGLAFVMGVFVSSRSPRRSIVLGLSVAAVAALVALPWWARNLATFGTPLPGQLSDNLLLVRNEQIFSYIDRPTLAGFLAQGAPALLANVGSAVWHDLVNVLIVPGGPIVALGLLTAALGLRRRGLRPLGALQALLGAGALCFAATSVLFPVATLWGTFEHAAGPLVVGLIVAALIGADAFVARVREWRNWPRTNAWLAPAGLAMVGLPLAIVALTGGAASADANAARIDQLASTIPAALQRAGVAPGTALISDRPIWLSEALARPAIALPDEPVDALTQLAADFGAGAIVVTEPRRDLPAALRSAAAAGCFSELTVPGLPASSAVFVVKEACR
jgi:hypothetical protein